jgi:pimeloyl-ACP methyl ester carboxylesterase
MGPCVVGARWVRRAMAPQIFSVTDTPIVPDVEGITHRWVDAGGIRLHVAEGGLTPPDAPVVVFLHGWPQHWWCWRHVLPLIAGSAHVVAPDLRGHGWSDAPPDGYEKEQLVDDLIALLDELGHDRVTLVGHDWGGWVGFLAALRHPERFDALVALGIVHPFQQPSIGRLLNAWRAAYQVFLASPIVGEIALRSSPRLVAEAIRQGTFDPDAIEPETRRHYGEVIQQPARARASVQMYRTFLLHEVGQLGRYEGQRLEVPTCLLVGRHDPVAVDAFLDGWQPHAEDMRVEVLERVGHFVPEEVPRRVALEVETLIGGRPADT